MRKKNTAVVALITLAILSLPLIAMQFNPEEVDWKLADFIVMGALIFITGMGIDWAINTKNKYRYVIAGAILIGFLLLWAEMAVGVFNSPIAGS